MRMNYFTKLTGVILMIAISFISFSQTKTSIILDADTGNEVDDLYAIVRAILEPTLEVTALNATQWQSSQWAVAQTMENSHRLNQVLLGHLDMNIKTCRGGVDRMFDWGDRARHSAAAYEIIKQAKALSDGEKLNVVALGALTNVASAIYIEPEIESKIRLYWLGTSYDFDKEIMTRRGFNCVMDIQALDILLLSDVEMHVIPSNVAGQMVFTYQETSAQLKGNHPLGDFLVDRWYNHLDGSRKERIIWDLALIEAIIHPEWTEKITVTTSRDNGNRPVHYYKSIDVEKMKADFFEKMEDFFQE